MGEPKHNLVFMSQEHVDRMNALLECSDAVRAACADLTAPRVLAYRLSAGPAGAPVHWRVCFDATVRFELCDGPADVVLVGTWPKTIAAARASRSGEVLDPEVTVEGNLDVLAEVAQVMELARAAATVPVDFPDVPAPARERPTP